MTFNVSSSPWCETEQLASGAGGPVLLTQAEKERLAELLRNVEEEEEDDASEVGPTCSLNGQHVVEDEPITFSSG